MRRIGVNVCKAVIAAGGRRGRPHQRPSATAGSERDAAGFGSDQSDEFVAKRPSTVLESPSMRRLLARIAIIFFGALLSAFAQQGADERYVEVYYLMQEGEALQERNQPRQALSKYLEAQAKLQALKGTYSRWNEKLVSYRLDYIASKVAALTEKGVATNVTATVSSPVTFDPASASNQVLQLQEELKRLRDSNATLEAKLKEALSVQPAAVDPKRLAEADERIKELQRERDLYKVSLEQIQTRASVPAEATMGQREREIFAEVERRLEEQTERANALERENSALRVQVAQLQTQTPPPGEVTASLPELQSANATIAALHATNVALRTEQILLESRLHELANQLSTVQRSRGGADRRTRETSAVKAAEVAELARELEMARARLETYEAKTVPYTPEELALFQQPNTLVAVAETSPPASKERATELPPGAGPLIVEAERAISQGRFEIAEQRYRDVLRQDPDNVYTLAHLAAVQLDQDKLGEAERALQRALSIDPRDAASLYLLGSLRLRQEQFDQAVDALSLSAKIDPNKAQTQYFLGRALIHTGQRASAETALRKAVQLKPGWGEAHYLLAVVYATQQPPFMELAQWHYQKAVSGGYPRNPELERWMEEKKGQP